MNSEKFFTWCRVAVKGIKYRPERDAVHEELYEHMEDRYESFRCRGLEHEEAVDKTVEAMGSAEELAPLLAKAHRPFWPYTLWVSRILLIITIIITIFPFTLFMVNNNFYKVSDPYDDLRYCDVYADSEYHYSEIYGNRMFYEEPNCSAKVDGFTFCVTKTAQWRFNKKPYDRFYLLLKVTKQFPWEELANDLDDYFWAEDSLGNHYYMHYSDSYSHTYNTVIMGGNQKGGLFSHTYELILSEYVSQDAQWIDLHYDRDGRNLVLRIDLNGGENP